jgi:hypothetical protein
MGSLVIGDFVVYQVFPLINSVLAVIYCMIPSSRWRLKKDKKSVFLNVLAYFSISNSNSIFF